MRHPAAETHVAAGRAQEVDDFGELGFGLLDPSHVVERHANLLRIDRVLAIARSCPERPSRRQRARPQHDEQSDQQQRRPSPSRSSARSEVPVEAACEFTGTSRAVNSELSAS